MKRGGDHQGLPDSGQPKKERYEKAKAIVVRCRILYDEEKKTPERRKRDQEKRLLEEIRQSAFGLGREREYWTTECPYRSWKPGEQTEGAGIIAAEEKRGEKPTPAKTP